MLTVVSGDMMALTSVSMKIVGTVCLSPILPKSVCICSCAELVMMSLSAIRVFIVLMLTKKGPFSCHTGQGTGLCHVNSGINRNSALISQHSGMVYSLTCQKETRYNVLHSFLLVYIQRDHFILNTMLYMRFNVHCRISWLLVDSKKCIRFLTLYIVIFLFKCVLIDFPFVLLPIFKFAHR